MDSLKTTTNRSSVDKQNGNTRPYLSDVKTLRDRARQNICDGSVTPSYQGDVKKTVEILQSVLATEMVCVLRYTMHAVAPPASRARESRKNSRSTRRKSRAMRWKWPSASTSWAVRPTSNPKGLVSRSASEYGSGGDLIEMMKENLVAEGIAIDHYRELIDYFGHRRIPPRARCSKASWR